MRLVSRLAPIVAASTLLVAAQSTMAQSTMAQSPSAARVVGGQMQLNRYSTATAAPAESVAQPLDAMVRLSYPRQTVNTVGEAIDHSLARSGWRLVDQSALEQQARHLLTLPLPDSQRTLGPYPVRTVLDVLTGPAWQWHEDKVKRLVWFDLRPEFRPKPVQTPVASPSPQPQVNPEPAVSHPVYDTYSEAMAASEAQADTVNQAQTQPEPPAEPEPTCVCPPLPAATTPPTLKAADASKEGVKDSSDTAKRAAKPDKPKRAKSDAPQGDDLPWNNPFYTN